MSISHLDGSFRVSFGKLGFPFPTTVTLPNLAENRVHTVQDLSKEESLKSYDSMLPWLKAQHCIKESRNDESINFISDLPLLVSHVNCIAKGNSGTPLFEEGSLKLIGIMSSRFAPYYGAYIPLPVILKFLETKPKRLTPTR